MTTNDELLATLVNVHSDLIGWFWNTESIIGKYGKIACVLIAVLIVLCVVILINQIKIKKQLRQLLEDRSASRKAEESAPADGP